MTEKNSDSEVNLLYYYYSGIVFIAFDNFSAAKKCFEMTLAVKCPDGVSAIAIESLKKFIIISLITEGHFSLKLHLCSFVPNYIRLAKDISEGSPIVLENFEKQNRGLIKRAMKSRLIHNAVNEIKYFERISFSDVEKRLQMPFATFLQILPSIVILI